MVFENLEIHKGCSWFSFLEEKEENGRGLGWKMVGLKGKGFEIYHKKIKGACALNVATPRGGG